MPRGNTLSQPSTSRAGLAVQLPRKRGRPSLSDLILRAVCVSTARKGASLALIKKTLATEGYDVVRNSGRLKAALGGLVTKGLLQRVTGTGIAGSFRIGRVGKERMEGAARSERADGETRQRPAGKTKGPRRAVKATPQRLKKPRRPRGKTAAAPAEPAAEGAEAAGRPEAAVAAAAAVEEER
ncbi:histone H1.01-like [Aythya fuligula]|uniref:Histone H1.01-like n=1 Tax=Aythya fuligula TaxID=219594 RepID=A0A6J3EI33_AYTFU|nr:histone H1.01-like [Aythya fuligula]